MNQDEPRLTCSSLIFACLIPENRYILLRRSHYAYKTLRGQALQVGGHTSGGWEGQAVREGVELDGKGVTEVLVRMNAQLEERTR
jgi:hypothetical protein